MIKQLARSISDRLGGEPLALALVVINLLFIAVGAFVLHETAKSQVRRDTLITDLIRSCVQKTEEQSQ